MKLRSIKEHERLSSSNAQPSGSHYDNRHLTSSVSSSSRSQHKTDLDLNLHAVLKAARITDIALLPKYLTHDSYAVRQMAEMRFIRMTESI